MKRLTLHRVCPPAVREGRSHKLRMSKANIGGPQSVLQASAIELHAHGELTFQVNIVDLFLQKTTLFAVLLFIIGTKPFYAIQCNIGVRKTIVLNRQFFPIVVTVFLDIPSRMFCPQSECLKAFPSRNCRMTSWLWFV